MIVLEKCNGENSNHACGHDKPAYKVDCIPDFLPGCDVFFGTDRKIGKAQNCDAQKKQSREQKMQLYSKQFRHFQEFNVYAL